MGIFLINVARFMCFMVSNFGYYNLLRRRTKLNVTFIPLITIGIQVTILFVAGILNLLLPAAAAMLVSGVLLFAMDLFHKRAGEYRSFAAVPYAYMGICLAVLTVFLHGKLFFEFDDFSHWATVVQNMLGSNAFPNFTSERMLFATYPLGSSVYIYYGALLAGTDESTQMLLQAFMMVCAMMPLFCCSERHKLGSLGLVLILTGVLFSYNINVTSLRVDTLLPLVAMGTFLITWELCNGREAGNPSSLWAAAPLLITTVMIKHSGMFFVLPALVALGVHWKRNPGERGRCAAVMASPLAALLIWNRHCDYVFADAFVSKHAVSVQNYAEVLGEKTAENIENTGRLLVLYLQQYPALIIMLALLLGAIAAVGLFHRVQMKKVLSLSGIAVGMYLAYVLGLYGMYVFSMPQLEAAILPQLDRYLATMDIAAFYLMAAWGLDELAGLAENRKVLAGITGGLAAAVLLFLCLFQWQHLSETEDCSVRLWLDDIIEEYQIPQGSACVAVTCNNEIDGYMLNALGYLLWSDAVCMDDMFSQSNEAELHCFPYIIMLENENDFINGWIEENYPEQMGRRVIKTNLQKAFKK